MLKKSLIPRNHMWSESAQLLWREGGWLSESPRPGPPSQPRCAPVLRPQFQTLILRVLALSPSLPSPARGSAPGWGWGDVLTLTGRTVRVGVPCALCPPPPTGSSFWRLRCYHFSSAQLTVGQGVQYMFVEQNKWMNEGKNDDVVKEIKATTSLRNILPSGETWTSELGGPPTPLLPNTGTEGTAQPGLSPH